MNELESRPALSRRDSLFRGTGVLLVNLGTPAAPRAPEVRRYLREFLGDPRVIDVPAVGRWLLLNLIILPFRPRKSAEAYAKVWTPEGSPLLVHGLALARALQARRPECRVELAMRYGEPSVAAALGRLRAVGCERVVVVPLFPQYASSSTGSALEHVYAEAGRLWNVPHVSIVPPFFDAAPFLDAEAAVARPHLERFGADHVVFSFHGLPERQIRKSDDSGGHCLASETCCAEMCAANAWCYRAQCFATARGVAARLGLEPGRSTVAFQSRLGRTPWIGPYTDHVLPALASQGVRRVAVMCPAFVADCLETLEEIGLRARADFQAAGGEDLLLVPSLNAETPWVEALDRLVAPYLG